MIFKDCFIKKQRRSEHREESRGCFGMSRVAQHGVDRDRLLILLRETCVILTGAYDTQDEVIWAAAFQVLCSRVAMVIGPTPRGTGVIQATLSLAFKKSTSP